MIGAEYLQLHSHKDYKHEHTHLKAGSGKGKTPDIPDLAKLRDAEVQYAYNKYGYGTIVYPDMYAAYNKLFYGVIRQHLEVKSSFEKLTNTAWWEQYMVNQFQFSAAKNATEMRMLQENVYDENHNKRSLSEFKNLPEVKDILDKFSNPNKGTWLNTEYELASRGAVMSEKWTRDFKDKDINPYWIYVCADAPCEICEPLDGMIFSFDDAQASDLYPSNHFNCYCTTEPTFEAGDDDEKLATSEEIEEALGRVPEQFQGNVGKDGIFPREGSSYYETLPNANDGQVSMFDDSNFNAEEKAEPKNKTILNTRKYNDYAVRLTVREWHKVCFSSGQDLIFQNREWLLNVRLTPGITKKLGKKIGFQNLRQCIEHPDEIWGRWQNPKEQKGTILTYLLHDGKKTFIVETEKGVIRDFYWRQHQDSKDLRRIGLKFMR